MGKKRIRIRGDVDHIRIFDEEMSVEELDLKIDLLKKKMK